ncbi:MAG: type I pantothenate kinase [Candidatus Anaerobiospirillum merdipullorum]|uniref:Pantothenate kinase n=1 Tax=Candidatus Anaerobiospirillum merdipullorum TaxID=2838450 RepID=A0A9E2NSD6_9GAMM|nr:type I pantothenate kinase [Candidatus Anaerobiospirillum merdipullorum]
MDKLDFTSPFFKFTPEVWATFAHSSNRLQLTQEQLKDCLAFNDRITLEAARTIYLPLSRLLYLYERSRHNRARVITQFLGKDFETSPFIISISGSVSVGKTTTAKLLYSLIKAWPTAPKVSLITTDGYLYPNKILEERGIMNQKGFPISYDVKRLMKFLIDVKDGVPNLKVPQYSHLTYDVIPDAYTMVDRPDILIIEGVNVLQNGADYPQVRNRIFISDFIDFAIYVDAQEQYLINWYIERFLKLRESTFDDPKSYFHRYAHMPEQEAIQLARIIWQSVNHQNLIENILPCRNRAHLILQKGPDHSIEYVYLRK